MFLEFLEVVLGVMVTPKGSSSDSAEVRFAQDDTMLFILDIRSIVSLV